jgi:hypothetical protein
VPTTTFRPVVTYDPATGTSSTSMQPCTTYRWQVQRAPFFGLGDPPPYFIDGTAAPTGYIVSPAPGLIEPGAFAPSTTSSPAFAPPAAAPVVSPLAPPVPDATRGFSGASGWGSSSSSSGADQRPTLTPGEAQGLQNLQPVPSTSNYPPIPLSDPVDTRQPASEQPPSSAPVKPVPDPEARPESKDAVPAAPALFDPGDRTAAHWVRPAAVIAPIVWAKPSPAEVKTTHRELPRLDATGWRVVQP